MVMNVHTVIAVPRPFHHKTGRVTLLWGTELISNTVTYLDLNNPDNYTKCYEIATKIKSLVEKKTTNQIWLLLKLWIVTHKLWKRYFIVNTPSIRIKFHISIIALPHMFALSIFRIANKWNYIPPLSLSIIVLLLLLPFFLTFITAPFIVYLFSSFKS